MLDNFIDLTNITNIKYVSILFKYLFKRLETFTRCSYEYSTDVRCGKSVEISRQFFVIYVLKIKHSIRYSPVLNIFCWVILTIGLEYFSRTARVKDTERFCRIENIFQPSNYRF